MRSTASNLALVVACAFLVAGASSAALRPPHRITRSAPTLRPSAGEKTGQRSVGNDQAASVKTAPLSSPSPRPVLASDVERTMVERARLEVVRGVRYDATYKPLLSYPRGDVPPDVGACTDLVIRALRAADVDLQVLVHEDVLSSPANYPFDDVGDASIDHRRVATLYAYFEHNTLTLAPDVREPWTFRPGDVVFYAKHRCSPGWPCIAGHVALVSDRLGPRGMPLVLQNGGPHAVESDALDQQIMVGHFRLMTSYLALRATKR